MANSQQIIEASGDADLLDRALALGIGVGISEQGIRNAFRKIVSGEIEVGGETTSVAVVYDYAKNNYENAVKALPPPPGKNLAGVTDDILIAAIQQHAYIEV